MMREKKIGSMITVLMISATFLSACGKITLPTLLVLDPAATNTLTIKLPATAGGATLTSNLVGNVNTTVTIDTNKLITLKGTPATVVVTSFATAGSSVSIGSLPTGTMCTYIPAGDEAGGIAYLDPLFTQKATFQLTIPTETKSLNPLLASYMPPIPFLLKIDATAKLDLMGAINLLLNGTGLSFHQVLNLTIPDDIPTIGGSPVVMDTVMTSTKTPVTDPLLTECEAALAAK